MLGNRRDELPDPAGQRAGNGFFLIIIATAIVGLAGYVITWLVPRSVGVGRYAAFAVFWSFVFLVAAALSGIQQETTRATVRATSRLETTPRARAGVFAVGSSVVTAALISATAPLWVGLVFGSDWRMVWPLVVGGASYVLLAVLAGTLYGISQWRSIFWVMTIEGVLRLVLV
ncbi:MAG: hypothetical protein JWR83_3105, partial [Aeromicrobium sp.]|nr:hypothetical protein [Aeromicrobium sp.]